MKIALIGCSKKKLGKGYPTRYYPAKDIYQGYSFKKSKNEGVNLFRCDDYYILSAKHHLLDKNEKISYYDVSLYDNGVSNIEWAEEVLNQLINKFDLSKDEFYIFASEKYYKYLVDHLNCTIFNYNGRYITFDIKKHLQMEENNDCKSSRFKN